MIIYKPGDVVLLPFPFTDLTISKHRPALVISSSNFNLTKEDIIVTAITSHLPSRIRKDEYLLDGEIQSQAGLPLPSIVKTAKLLTIDKRLIYKTLGKIPAPALREIIKLVMAHFAT